MLCFMFLLLLGQGLHWGRTWLACGCYHCCFGHRIVLTADSTVRILVTQLLSCVRGKKCPSFGLEADQVLHEET